MLAAFVLNTVLHYSTVQDAGADRHSYTVEGAGERWDHSQMEEHRHMRNSEAEGRTLHESDLLLEEAEGLAATGVVVHNIAGLAGDQMGKMAARMDMAVVSAE